MNFLFLFSRQSLTDEVSALSEDKKSLETLCKRLKVQLIDTRKMLSASKTAEAELAASKAAAAKEVETVPQEPGAVQNGEMRQQQLALLQNELDTTRQKYK